MHMCVHNIITFQVNKSSSDFWKNQLVWRPYTELPYKGWVLSVATLDKKVYAMMLFERGGYVTPFMYDPDEDKWSSLPELPYIHCCLVAVPDRKQLLAIGGMVSNHGKIVVSNKVFLWDKNNNKWTTPYPNMPTARYRCSCISHHSKVIVAGGVTCQNPWTMTRVVEVLHIHEHSWFTGSHWSVVEQLPYIVRETIPLIVNDKLYFAQGYEATSDTRTCNIVTAFLSELLQSSSKNTSNSSGQVWNKLPDMPYSSYSINHYQGRLITFGGDHKVERPDEDKPVWELVSLIHIYNPDTNTWDCVGEIPHTYLLGKSVHIKNNEFLFMGGLTGKHSLRKDDDMVTTCSMLTIV